MLKLHVTLREAAMTLKCRGKITEERILVYFGGKRTKEIMTSWDRL